MAAKIDSFDGYSESVTRYHANLTPRAWRLIQLESYVIGDQYAGRKSWWDDSVPLQERAPCLVYPLARIAIQSNVDLVLGEGRFPGFTTKQSEDEGDEENGLSPEDSSTLDRLVREIHRLCRFRSHARDAFASAQGTGSCAAIHGVRGGKPFADLVPAKWCEPEIGSDGEVLKLVIQYPFQETSRQSSGKWRVKTMLYRRVIDAQRDVEYLPGEARGDGAEPAWVENKDRTVAHGFGFCPVVWYPFMKGCVPINVIDGHAIHEGLYDEIEAHDFAISMRHRAALYAGDPQIIEIGVEPGHNPSAPGRMAGIPTTADGGAPTKDNPVIGTYYPDGAPGTTRQARRRGAGVVWQYEDEHAKVQLLTLPGDALKAVDDNARDLRIKLQESMCVVFLDPENVKFAATTSGKALQAIKQRQLDRCDQFRDDLTERFFEPSVSMQLRVIHSLLGRKGASVKVPGATKVKPILDKFFLPERPATDADGKAIKDARGSDVMLPSEWQMPTLQTVWGSYFAPDVDEEKKIVEMVNAAMAGDEPTITIETAVQKLAPVFAIENVKAYVDELKKAKAERTKEAIERTSAENSMMHEAAKKFDQGDDDADAIGNRSGPPGERRDADEGGGGGAAFADPAP